MCTHTNKQGTPTRETEMNATLTAKALLADNPNLSLDELTAYAAGLDPKAEDLFWAAVREERPTLCSEWTD